MRKPDRFFRESDRRLANLRWLAVVGQGLTLLIVSGPMRVALPAGPLWAGIGALAFFNVYATCRRRSIPSGRS